MRKKLIALFVLCYITMPTSVYAWTEMGDADLSQVQGQSEGVGGTISNLTINKDGTDTAKFSINLDDDAASELALSHLRLIKHGGGDINIGTPEDPIIMGDVIKDNGIDVLKMSMPKELSHYTPMDMELLLTSKYSQDHLVKLGLVDFVPWAIKRNKKGQPVQNDNQMPNQLYVWSDDNQGISLASVMSFRAAHLILQASQNGSSKGKFDFFSVEFASPLGVGDSVFPGVTNHPLTFNTFDSNGKLGFVLQMESSQPNNPDLALGYLQVKSLTVPDVNDTVRTLVPDNVGLNFINVTGIEVQGIVMTAIQD